MPHNAHYVYESCTACGVTSTIISGWACNSGYVKVGNTCQKAYASCSAANMWCCHGEYLGCNNPDKYFSGNSFKCLPASTEVCNALLYDCEQDCGVKYPDNYASDEYLNCLQECRDSGSKYEKCMSKI